MKSPKAEGGRGRERGPLRLWVCLLPRPPAGRRHPNRSIVVISIFRPAGPETHPPTPRQEAVIMRSWDEERGAGPRRERPVHFGTPIPVPNVCWLGRGRRDAAPRLGAKHGFAMPRVTGGAGTEASPPAMPSDGIRNRELGRIERKGDHICSASKCIVRPEGREGMWEA